MKKEIKSLDPTELDLPENTKIFINETLHLYSMSLYSGTNPKNQGQFRKYKFYAIRGLIHVKLEETGPSKIITHMVDLKEYFPDIDIEKL